MKNCICFLILLLFVVQGFSQSKDIDVLKKFLGSEDFCRYVLPCDKCDTILVVDTAGFFNKGNFIVSGKTVIVSSTGYPADGYTAIPFDAPNVIGDRIIYYAWDKSSGSVMATHSAIVTKVDQLGYTTEVESKWGEGHLYRHHPRDVPSNYSSKDATFTAPDGKIYPSRVCYRKK